MVSLTPSSSYSLAIDIELPNRCGKLAQVLEAIAKVGGSLGEIELTERTLKITRRVITVDAGSQQQADEIVAALEAIEEIKIIEITDRTFELHKGGKISVVGRIPLTCQSDLAMAYTPGVGRICRAIADNPESVYKYTIKSNTVAIVSDGSAVLGLGNLGPEAALPVMEGKAMLFKNFADVDAFPICLAGQDTETIVETIKQIAPVFGGINLEDIAAPRCFEIEEKLKAQLDIPVFHDDQQGTAIVTLAALINALKVVGKTIEQIKIVINGAGAAGIAVARLLRAYGAQTIWICDSRGILSVQRDDLGSQKKEFAVSTSGDLAKAMEGADVFIGLSAPNVVSPEMLKAMNSDPIVFAMANPIPEIQPELTRDIVAVMATGRSDYPNQINNVLAFPGVFRGALDCRAKTITTGMCLAASAAIAKLVESVDKENIVPSVFDPLVARAVSTAVIKAARQEGIATL